MLSDNIIFLKKNYPKLYEAIEKEDSSKSNITIENTKNSQKTIKIKKEDKDYYLHSRYNPLREAEAIINKLEEKEKIDENSYVIFYGLGLGYHIEVFTKRYPHTSFSLYEPSVNVFQHFLDNISLKRLQLNNIETLQCEFAPNSPDIFLSTILNKIDKKIVIMDLPVYENVFKQQHNDFFSKFNKYVKATRGNLYTDYTFQKRWIINSMKNLKNVLSTPNIVSEKRGEFKGKTAIIAAAGPSLDDEIENLRHIKDNGLAYIFSVGSAINTLIYNNIYPHAVCTIDPGAFNQNVFKTIKEKGIFEIPMIFGSSVGYETLDNYPGNKYHMITSKDSIALYYLRNDDGNPINIILDAPTVAAATLQLLYILGFDKIILVGQNLGYLGNKGYSEGIPYYNSELKDKQIENGVWVKDVYGNRMLSANVFINMKSQIELYIKHFPNINVINATKGGANIEGAEFIELNELIENELTEKIVDKNELNIIEKNEISYDKEYMLSQSENMDKDYQKALKINNEYRTILKKIEKIIDNRNYNQARNLYVKLDKELRKIENNDFYKTFILPMNRVQYKVLADSIESINTEKNPDKQGRRILSSFGNFIDICTNDIENIKPIYDEMREVFNEI